MSQELQGSSLTGKANGKLEVMVTALLFLSFFVWGLAVLIMTFGTWKAMTHLNAGRRPLTHSSTCLPVTILKPLKGIDSDIEENLESFFRLRYEEFEILHSVADQDDPVVPIVQRLIAKYPNVNAKLFIGSTNYGPNPKVNNLIQPYEHASHDCILISDSNTRFEPDHLSRLTRQFDEGVDMQTSLVAGVSPSGLGGHLEAVFLNTVYARSMVVLAAAGFPCVMGKAMMFRKSVMDKTRGLRSLKRHIAEDYAAGRKFQLLGYKVQLSQNPVPQHIGRYSVRAFWSRHIRWGRIRKMQSPFTFAIEPLFSSLLSGVIGAYAFHQCFGFSIPVLFTLHFGIWMTCDAFMAAAVGNPLTWKFVPVWLFRELIHLPLWAHISVGKTILWRGQKIQLQRADILETRAAGRESDATLAS